MIKLLFIKTLAFVLINQGLSDCPHKVDLTTIKNTSSINSNDGSIEFSVQTSDSYDIILSRVSAASGVIEIQKIKGSGNKSFEFKNLSKSNFYQISVIFQQKDTECPALELFPISVK